MSVENDESLALVYAISGNFFSNISNHIATSEGYSKNAVEAYADRGVGADSRDVKLISGEPRDWQSLISSKWNNLQVSATLRFGEDTADDQKKIAGTGKQDVLKKFQQSNFSDPGPDDFEIISDENVQEAIEEFNEANLKHEKSKLKDLTSNYSAILQPDAETSFSGEIEEMLEKSDSKSLDDLVMNLGDKSNPTCTSDLNIDSAEKILEISYTRDNFREEIKQVEPTAGKIAGKKELLIADKTSSTWEDRWGNVMARDAKTGEHFKLFDKDSKTADSYDDEIEEKLERISDEEISGDYDSRLEKMVSEISNSYETDHHLTAAMLKAAHEGRLEADVEDYLFNEYLENKIDQIGEIDELHRANEVIYGQLYSDLKSERPKGTKNLVDESHKPRNHLNPQLTQADHERGEGPSQSNVSNGDSTRGLLPEMIYRILPS